MMNPENVLGDIIHNKVCMYLGMQAVYLSKTVSNRRMYNYLEVRNNTDDVLSVSNMML